MLRGGREIFLIFFPEIAVMSKSTNAPDDKRIVVKLAASIADAPSARRHKTEFAAKAKSASDV